MDPTPSSNPRKRPPRFSEQIDQLIAAFAERGVRVRDVLGVMHSRGYTMLLMLLAFPFCTPIPLPGLSMPFGLAVAIIGLRLALGQRPWLPARIMSVELPAQFLPRLLKATRWLVQRLELLLRPRWSDWVRWRPIRQGMGAIILMCGALLMLPLPIPFSNGFPAVTVLLLAAAMLEDDGYFALAGLVMFALTIIFFAALFWGGAEVAGYFIKTFGDAFRPDDQAVPASQ